MVEIEAFRDRPDQQFVHRSMRRKELTATVDHRRPDLPVSIRSNARKPEPATGAGRVVPYLGK